MSRIQPIRPGGVGTGGSTPVSIVSSGGGSSAAALQTVAGTGQWVVLARLLLDSGDQYLAAHNIRYPGRFYEGRVLEWGRVDQSIPVMPGMPQTSDAQFRIADTDRFWRDIFMVETLEGRTIELKFVRADSTEPNYEPFFVGTIFDFRTGPGWVEIQARDSSWDWLDVVIPPLLTRENFSYLLPESEGAFLPIVLGFVTDTNAYGLTASAEYSGVVPLIRMGDSPVHPGFERWAVARHPCFDMDLFRRVSGDPLFYAIDPAEYDVTVETHVIDGFSYSMTFIDFLVDNTGTDAVSANIQGSFYRGAFGDYPAIGQDDLEYPGGTPELVRNPIDHFITLTRQTSQTESSFSHDRIMAIRDTFETLGWVSDVAITTSETLRVLLGQLLTNFALDMFHARDGSLCLNFTDESDPQRPLFSDNSRDGLRQLIGRNTFFESKSPAANRCRYPAFRHYGLDSWMWSGIYDNTADRAAIDLPERDDDGNPIPAGSPYVRDPKINEIVIEMWFCRDKDTLDAVVPMLMSRIALGSFQQSFDLPTPEVIDDTELCKLVGITHAFGLAPGGYKNVEAKIIAISRDLRGFRTTLTTQLRTPATIVAAEG